jgi:hypothetical protein
MTQRICPLGHSIGALQQLQRLLDHKVLTSLVRTQADRDYVKTGLAGAIQQLQWLSANQVAIKAALAAVKAAEAGNGERV